MKRIKNLGLAVVSALALTALGATSASAAEFVSESSPSTVVTSGLDGQHSLTFHSLVTSCDAPSLEASAEETNNQTLATAADDTSCNFLGGSSPMEMNGCGFVFHPGAEKSPGVFKGKFDIGPANCGPIKLVNGGSICPITIGAQTGFAATYENIGSGTERSVKVTVNATKLVHTQGGSSCTNGTFSDGEWSGSWTLQGSEGGNQTGLWVEAAGPNIFIDGTPPQLQAVEYPMSLAAEESSAHTLQFQAGSAKCDSADFASSVSGPTSELSVQATYGGCKFLGLSATVKMNGCGYEFDILNQEPVGSTYFGHADIACPAGKEIEIVTPTTGKVKCTVRIPGQTTDAGGLTFENQANSIGIGLSVKGIDYHQQKGEGIGACTTTGEFTTGTYSGSSILSAVL